MAEGGDIIIKGGSAEIHFNNEHFPKNESDPKKRKHEAGQIVRIKVSGTGENDFTQEFPGEGFKGTIIVSYR